MNNDQPEIRKIDRMTVRDRRLDELVIHKPTMVHIEDMGDHYWMAIYVGGEARRYVLSAENVTVDGGPEDEL